MIQDVSFYVESRGQINTNEKELRTGQIKTHIKEAPKEKFLKHLGRCYSQQLKTLSVKIMEFRIILSLAFASIFQINEVLGSKIIMSAPQATSHVMVQTSVASELITRGHEVYMAIGSRIYKPEKLEGLGIKILYYNIPEDVIFGLTEDFDRAAAECAFNQCSVEYVSSLMVTRDCSLMMQDESFKRKAKDLRFDLALIEPFISAPCTLIPGHYLELPFVSMATMLLPWELRIPAQPSFYRILGWYPIADGSTFTGRVTNLVSFIIAETSILIPGPRNTTLLQQYP